MSEEQLSKKERKELKKQEQAAQKQAQAESHRAAAKKKATIILLSAIAIFAFIAWIINAAPEKPSLADLDSTPDTINSITELDHIKGNVEDTAKVTIIEYSDFQCPACRAYYQAVKQLVAEYPEDVRFVYRHLPIQTIHPNATLAARYGEAAGLQGKFFEMHDMIFDEQPNWSNLSSRAARETFVGYGESLGLDTFKLTEDADSEATTLKIESDRIDGIGAGAQGTPTFFVNGERLERNPAGYEGFVELVTGETAEPKIQIDTEALEAVIEASQTETATQ